jgi:hypothetical protein
VQTLSPATAITLSNLDVAETGGAVSPEGEILVAIAVNNTAPIRCTILGGQSTCTSGGTTIVPAGSQLSIIIDTIAGPTGIPGFDLLFGFEATS